jgi:tRNA G46 methylase TrmB
MKLIKKAVKKTIFTFERMVTRTFSVFDKRYLSNDVPLAKISHHKRWMPYVAEFGNKKGMKILEIGSRGVTGDYFKP